MKRNRRQFIATAAALAALPGRALRAQAKYPNRSIQVICPLQAASPSDVAARAVCERMSASLGVGMPIENQPGAAGLIGTERVARAAPDGYLLGALNNSIMTMLPHMYAKVPYDPFRSFEPICMLASIPTLLIVHADVPAKNVRELVEYSKAHAGKLNYSSGGAGSPQHLAMEMFKSMTGANLTHVPYKGATQATLDLVGGQVQAMFIGVALALPFIKAGKVRALGMAGAQRTALMPELPTIAEQGVAGYDYASWIALYAPAGTPKDIVATLGAEARKALADKGLRDTLLAGGLDPIGGTSDELVRQTREDYARMGKVIKDAGVTAA
jgi:tripartite-type tricarboxylate transporter receptor subunit TctC